MKKLRLDLDGLAAESFQTGEAATTLGTVEGHITCAHDSCTPYPSIHNTRCGCTPVFVQAHEAMTRPQVCDPITLPPHC